MYLSELDTVLYLRDRAMLNYHWFKVGSENVDAILAPPKEDADTLRRAKAHRIWLEPYLGSTGIDELTAREFLEALSLGQVPDWVIEIAPLAELKQKVR